MTGTINDYRTTGTLLKILSIIMLAAGIYRRSPSIIAIGFGYWVAAPNPMRYRMIINVGLILHTVQFCLAVFALMAGDGHGAYINLVVSPVILGALIMYYPSHYPVSSNILNFLLPSKFNVSVVEAYPVIMKKLAGNGLIGKVEGLYINSDAPSIIQEKNFLGFSPSGDIIDLCKKAELQSEKTLLDVGCGLGGPACLLAAEFGLDVTGVDLLDWNVEKANTYASQRGLSSHCRFKQANALSLPFAEGSFDYVFGMDAWCHVPGRDNMLKECSRVLKNDGIILFHDWIRVKGDSEGFRFIYSFPPLETMESYAEKLNSAGFEIIGSETRNDVFKTHVDGLRDSIRLNKRRLIDVCGRELYDNWDFVVEYTYKMIDEQIIGKGRFIARKK